MKNVLVTGGTGFLGANLTVELVKRGHNVRIFYREGDHHPFLDNLEVQHFAGDIRDKDLLKKAVAGCDAVFHTVGNASFWKSDRPIQELVNVKGTENILTVAKAAGVKRVVHTSSINALGIPDPGTIGDENTAFNWESYDFNYATTKKKSEDVALSFNAPDFEVVVVNPGTIFGKGDINVNTGSYVKAIKNGQGYFTASGGTNCVSVDDVVKGHILAMEKGRPGEKYILGGENLTMVQLFKLIGTELGLSFHPVIEIPKVIAMGVSTINEFFFKLINKRTNLVPESVQVGYLKLFYSSAKAERELDYSAQPLNVAIREGIAFFREQEVI